MSVLYSAPVWEHAKANGLLVLLSLADQANDDGWCWPGHESMALRIRGTRSTVQRQLVNLEAAGEISIVERPGTTNMYYVRRAGRVLEPPQFEAPSTGGGQVRSRHQVRHPSRHR